MDAVPRSGELVSLCGFDGVDHGGVAGRRKDRVLGGLGADGRVAGVSDGRGMDLGWGAKDYAQGVGGEVTGGCETSGKPLVFKGGWTQIRSLLKQFYQYPFDHGLLDELSARRHPTRISAWNDGHLDLSADATHFGFCFSGSARLAASGSEFPVSEGMYFAIPGEGRVDGEGRGMIVSCFHHRGLFSLGGPIEQTGRLRYIDGCTDTLLIPPPILGDPCLNLLHIPPRTRQSSHTHPSLRLGLIVSGKGNCVTPTETLPLQAGTLFHIPADSQHGFHTEDEALRVIAYHPDSDFGPTHENHPMVNKTILS